LAKMIMVGTLSRRVTFILQEGRKTARCEGAKTKGVMKVHSHGNAKRERAEVQIRKGERSLRRAGKSNAIDARLRGRKHILYQGHPQRKISRKVEEIRVYDNSPPATVAPRGRTEGRKGWLRDGEGLLRKCQEKRKAKKEEGRFGQNYLGAKLNLKKIPPRYNFGGWLRGKGRTNALMFAHQQNRGRDRKST